MKKALLGVIAGIVLCFGGSIAVYMITKDPAIATIAGALGGGLLTLAYKVVDKIT